MGIGINHKTYWILIDGNFKQNRYLFKYNIYDKNTNKNKYILLVCHNSQLNKLVYATNIYKDMYWVCIALHYPRLWVFTARRQNKR